MKIRTLSVPVVAAAITLFVSGCSNCCLFNNSKTVFDCKFDNGTERAKVVITKAPGKVKLDGVIDPKEWKGSVAYPMSQAFIYRNEKTIPAKYFANMNRKDNIVDPFEGGTVRLMYDKENLYVAAELKDTDVMQYGTEDQAHLYLTGDTLEMFLKPANSPKYWECYGTPNGKKTSLFFDTRGYPRHNDRSVLMPGIKNAVKIQGTINNFNDKDKGWTIEVVIPKKELDKTGCEFKPGVPWTILISRYNYNYGSKEGGAQFATVPELPVVNYHLLEYYADLVWK